MLSNIEKFKFMKLKKGSLEAKRFMAKIRAKKGKSKKVSGIKKTLRKKTPTKNHTDIKSHNYKISIGENKNLKKEIFIEAILQTKGLLFYLKKLNGATLKNSSRKDYLFAVQYKLQQVEKGVKEVLKLN